MFKLSIVSPARVLYEQEIRSLVVPGSEGYLGVLSHHAPLITALTPGKITITEADENERIAAVSGGFLEVSGNVATILAESVEFTEEIDVERAKTAYHRAKKRLGLKSSDVDMDRAMAALRRAENRLKIAEGGTPS